jgi:predicted RNA-binding Zn-ribbon protein involved in translation (DUF1610 family)
MRHICENCGYTDDYCAFRVVFMTPDAVGDDSHKETELICPKCGSQYVIRIDKAGNELIGSANYDDLVEKTVEWLQDSDKDKVCYVIGIISGTMVCASVNDSNTVYIFNCDDRRFGDLFYDILQNEYPALCEKCGYRSGITEFMIFDDGNVTDDLKCPMCGAVEIADRYV